MAKDQHIPKLKDFTKYMFVYHVVKNNSHKYLPSEYNLDIDLKDLDLNESPLHLACKNNDHATAKLMLEHGARVNEREKTISATPCMLIARSKGDTVPLLKLLIEDFKADIYLTDNTGADALEYAKNCGNNEALVYLTSVYILGQEGA